ncbi:MAG: hypothetical protein LUI14_14515 [Lachnospiraceae bacterium]|nr:hypothetical protein [Lachnospiraceae bacterium]
MIILAILAVLLLLILIPVALILGGGALLFGWLFLDIAVFAMVAKALWKAIRKKK